VPSRIDPEKLADTRGTTGMLGGVEGGIEGGVVGGIVGGVSSAVPAPPPPPAPPSAKRAPVRIGGQIKAPGLISRVDPVYRALAQAAQLAGIVILATVGETGRVESVRIRRAVGPLRRRRLRR
jgi:protein TonB